MRVRRATTAIALTLASVGAAAAGDPGSPVDRLAACAVAQAQAIQMSGSQAERALATRRLEALRGLVPRTARLVGVGEAEAEAALSRAMQPIETRSLSLDPPGTGGARKPEGCEAIADGPEDWLVGLRRR